MIFAEVYKNETFLGRRRIFIIDNTPLGPSSKPSNRQNDRACTSRRSEVLLLHHCSNGEEALIGTLLATNAPLSFTGSLGKVCDRWLLRQRCARGAYSNDDAVECGKWPTSQSRSSLRHVEGDFSTGSGSSSSRQEDPGLVSLEFSMLLGGRRNDQASLQTLPRSKMSR